MSYKIPSALESIPEPLTPESLDDGFPGTPSATGAGSYVKMLDAPAPGGMTVESMLQQCDIARAALRETKTLGPEAEKLSRMLEVILKDEVRGVPSVTFSNIMAARLDKLVADILNPSYLPSPIPLRFRVDMSMADSLQRSWRRQHKDNYFAIDELRQKALPNDGILKDVSFEGLDGNGDTIWRAKSGGTVSEMEARLQFEPGHWWLNLACARRDGMVAGDSERPTKSIYGLTTLPLLTGREEIQGDLVKYVREGKQRDMHFSLMSQVGTQLRILRGSNLHSLAAPSAGVRYDGAYVIRRFGIKLDARTETYRLELLLERMPGQTSLEGLAKVPRPSQLDDWDLYCRIEEENVRQEVSERELCEWKLRREAARMEAENWRRARIFTAALDEDAGGINPPRDRLPG